MTLHGIDFPVARLAEFGRANGVRRLAVFGSILREDSLRLQDMLAAAREAQLAQTAV